MKVLRIVISTLGAAAMLTCPATLVQSAMLTEDVDIECRQPEPLSLQCNYRILNGADLISVTAENSGIIINGKQIDDNIAPPRRTANLFLVDTSNPMRNREHIRRLAGSGAPHHVYGLASFDSQLKVLCDMGCSAADVASKTQDLFATGEPTELYRNVLEAIKILRTYDARKRQIILMSDGLAEDLAYHHEDVIKAARNGHIVISSVGYPRSVPQSVALQTLRRLSEETGGLFVQADHIDYGIPEVLFTRIMSAVDSGGYIEFKLNKLQQQSIVGNIEISLSFQTTEQSFLLLVPIIVPEAVPAVVPATSIPPHKGITSWFWYGLPAMVFSAFLAIAISYAVLAKRRREDEELNAAKHAMVNAFLIFADNEEIRHKIDHTPWRIGRARNNNLILDHASVSRLHAEIRRDALGQFTLQDLGSLNGVFVNGEAIDMSHLDENDRVKIGNVSFIFTMHEEDYARQDATILIHTRTPSEQDRISHLIDPTRVVAPVIESR